MIRTPLTLSLLAALVAAPAAWAATPINQTRPLEARGHVEIDNVKGSIQVRTWDKKEVHVGGSLGKGVEKLTIEGDENDLVIKVEYPRRDSGWGRTGPPSLDDFSDVIWINSHSGQRQYPF